MEDIFNSLLVTLNSIEVKGKDNMDKLMGCILLCEHQLAKIRAEESTGEVSEDG